MANYVFTYHGEPKFKNPEEGGKYMVRWQAWVGNLGKALVNPGVPFGKSKAVSSSGVSDDAGSNRVTGFLLWKPTAWMLLSN